MADLVLVRQSLAKASKNAATGDRVAVELEVIAAGSFMFKEN